MCSPEMLKPLLDENGKPVSIKWPKLPPQKYIRHIWNPEKHIKLFRTGIQPTTE